VSQRVGRLRHHHETFWNIPDYVAGTSRSNWITPLF